MGGCLHLLQVWIWERLLIGRPHRREVAVGVCMLLCRKCQLKAVDVAIPNLYHFRCSQEWPFEEVRPTVLFLWKDVQPVRGLPERRYLLYTNELDCVSATRLVPLQLSTVGSIVSTLHG